MKRRIALIAIATLLGCSLSWAQTSPPEAAAPVARPAAMAAPAEPAYTDLLARLSSAARQSDSNVMSLRIERWKAHRRTKRQVQETALSIHRNLAFAVPQLLQHAAAAPDSLEANFVLYRDLNVLYETYASLAESAGAYGPSDAYDMLAGDLSQFDQLRRELADRLQHMSAAADARLGRRPVGRAGGAKKLGKRHRSSSFHKIIVDENHRTHHRRRRHAPAKSEGTR